MRRNPAEKPKPGKDKTHRAYLWAFATASHEGSKAVVYAFSKSQTERSLKRPGASGETEWEKENK
jgi:hypothetical protein